MRLWGAYLVSYLASFLPPCPTAPSHFNLASGEALCHPANWESRGRNVRVLAPWHVAEMLGWCPLQIRMLERTHVFPLALKENMQSLSSTWDSWKSSCGPGGARAVSQHRIWRDRTSLAMRSLENWAQPVCPSPHLAEPWVCPFLAPNLPWHRANLCKGSCSTPPAEPGRDQLKYQLSPSSLLQLSLKGLNFGNPRSGGSG